MFVNQSQILVNSLYQFFPQNANATFKAVKTTTADLTVANVNVKKDIQEFIASCQQVRIITVYCFQNEMYSTTKLTLMSYATKSTAWGLSRIGSFISIYPSTFDLIFSIFKHIQSAQRRFIFQHSSFNLQYRSQFRVTVCCIQILFHAFMNIIDFDCN